MKSYVLNVIHLSVVVVTSYDGHVYSVLKLEAMFVGGCMCDNTKLNLSGMTTFCIPFQEIKALLSIQGKPFEPSANFKETVS